MNEDEVVWCYSLIDNDVIFIFRDRDKEIKINLKNYTSQSMYAGNWLKKEEKDLLSKLINK